MDRFKTRCDKLRKSFGKAGVDSPLLVTNYVNVTYLTGFTGDDSFLLVTGDTEVLLTDARYTTQLEEECPELHIEVRSVKTSMPEIVAQVVGRAKVARLGLEGESISIAQRDRLADKLPKVTMHATSGLVEQLRIIKDKEEINEIRVAADQAQRAFAVLRASLRPEQTEQKEVADQLEYQMRLFGAKGPSFPSIIAVGPPARPLLPHARPTNKRIGRKRLRAGRLGGRWPALQERLDARVSHR